MKNVNDVVTQDELRVLFEMDEAVQVMSYKIAQRINAGASVEQGEVLATLEGQPRHPGSCSGANWGTGLVLDWKPSLKLAA